MKTSRLGIFLSFMGVVLSFTFLCEAKTKTITRKITSVTADSIKPSGTGTKTTFTKSVSITKDLTTSGAAKLNGGLTMDTDKFVVNNGTGTTSIAGKLTVAGVTKLNGVSPWIPISL